MFKKKTFIFIFVELGDVGNNISKPLLERLIEAFIVAVGSDLETLNKTTLVNNHGNKRQALLNNERSISLSSEVFVDFIFSLTTSFRILNIVLLRYCWIGRKVVEFFFV